MGYPKMFAIRAGDILVTYAGFTCIPADTLVRIERDPAVISSLVMLAAFYARGARVSPRHSSFPSLWLSR